MLRKISGFCRAYPYVLLLLYPVFHVCFFFLLNVLPLEHHMIECSLDAKIPFCEWFLIPYCLWFLYLFGGMVCFFFVTREDFLRMCLFTMGGLAICLTICIVYPTAVAFRPTAFERDNLLIRLTQLIYAVDQPWNVCPSMHCYGAIGMTLAICKSKLLNRRRVVPICSVILCILICLSTMFIKQHSAVDVAAAVALAVVLYPLAYCVDWKFLHGRDAAEDVRRKLRPAAASESNAAVQCVSGERILSESKGQDDKSRELHTRIK